MSKHKNLKKIIFIVLVVATLTGLFFLLQKNHVLSHRALRKEQQYVLSYGTLAPIVIISMMVISTAVPPLPLPVPLVEIASGVIFGFWEGWIIVWLGQIISSFMAFAVVRYFNKRFLGKWLKNKRWNFYHTYLRQSGVKAILITRATLSSPFNIISFLAGLSSMPWKSFLWATALGVIPETVLYTFIGSELGELHIRLIWLSTIVLAVSFLGFGITFLVTGYLKPKLIIKEKKTSVLQ
jgi:uncharacterized membrane protein YdjX (TVP38/TMEM64 family)